MEDKITYSYSGSFPSDKSTLKDIEEILDGLRRKLRMEDETYYNILICVTESVNNAIVHGNKKNPDLAYSINIEATASLLKVIIKDMGRGFDPEQVPDPTLQENLLRDGGRGVYIIKQLAKESSFVNDGSGTIVSMLFDISR